MDSRVKTRAEFATMSRVQVPTLEAATSLLRIARKLPRQNNPFEKSEGAAVFHQKQHPLENSEGLLRLTRSNPFEE
jgi:hypothetical protein